MNSTESTPAPFTGGKYSKGKGKGKGKGKPCSMRRKHCGLGKTPSKCKRASRGTRRVKRRGTRGRFFGMTRMFD